MSAALPGIPGNGALSPPPAKLPADAPWDCVPSGLAADSTALPPRATSPRGRTYTNTSQLSRGSLGALPAPGWGWSGGWRRSFPEGGIYMESLLLFRPSPTQRSEEPLHQPTQRPDSAACLLQDAPSLVAVHLASMRARFGGQGSTMVPNSGARRNLALLRLRERVGCESPALSCRAGLLSCLRAGGTRAIPSRAPKALPPRCRRLRLCRGSSARPA